MNKKRIYLAVISLIVIVCLLAGCSSVPSLPTSSSLFPEGSSSQQSSSESVQPSESGEGEMTGPIKIDRKAENTGNYVDPNTIAIDYVDNDNRDMYLDPEFYPDSEVKTGWRQQDIIEVEGKYKDSFPPVTNYTPLEGIVSDVYDPWAVCRYTYGNVFLFTLQYYFNYGINDDYFQAQSINAFNINNTRGEKADDLSYRIPVSFLRQMDVEGWYYTVNRFEDGYFYCIFGPLMDRIGEGKYTHVSEDMTDLYYYTSIYSENVRSLSDFDSIGIGSSISDVIAIDSSAEITLATHRYYRINIETPFYRMVRSYLLLTDGLLVISYEPRVINFYEYYEGQDVPENYGDDLVVCDMVYYPDFNYSPRAADSSCEPRDPSEYYQDFTVPMHIYPYDYPKQ